MASKYISLDVLDKLDKNILSKIITEPISILCKNFESETQEIKSLNVLYSAENFFWRKKSSQWTYYVDQQEIDKYSNGTSENFYGFTDNYGELVQMSHEKRLEVLSESRNKLKALELKRKKENEEIADVMSTGSTDSIMLNKVIFDDLMKLTPEKAKEVSKAAVNETSEIVKIASNLMSDFSGDFSLFSNIVEKSNGSTIKHMTRTFIMTLAFFQYYNRLLNQGFVSKVRVNFDTQYKRKYEKLLKHVPYNKLTLERVFKGGMTVIPELETNAIGVGFLLHDIGKQVDLEYFEGAEGYIKERIQAHVANGFNELLKRTVYPPVVSAIAGFHHEYYGHKSGYGPLRDFIHRKFPNGIESDYCISYSLHEVYNGEALCFFPAKMLEIVDVYDALTDPGRKYREPLKPDEAVSFIRDKFLKEEVKVDPILFDMFELYLIDSGEIIK